MMKIVENRKYYISASAAVIAVGLIFMIVNLASGKGAFNYDVEFVGGTSFQIDVGQPFDNADIAGIVRETTGQQAPQVQQVTGGNIALIKMPSIDQAAREKLVAAVAEKYGVGADAFTYSDISPTVSADMRNSAILSVVSACAAMLVYVSFRFRDVRMGAAAIMALLHDSLVMIAAYVVLRIPLNYSFIAAVLTILGYSINATIVIFDRIRENRASMRKAPFSELVNVSITQTMRRSIFTSLTVFFVVLVLYVLGVPSIKEFSLPIIVGVLAGGYSSIFLAGTFWFILSKQPEPAAAAVPIAKASPQPAAPIGNSGGQYERQNKAAGAEGSNVRHLSSTPRKKNRRKH